MHDDYMQAEQRDYLITWHKQTKRIERFAGIGLIFTAAVLLIWDNPTDPTIAQIAVLAAALMIASGITFIFRSRRPMQARKSLQFLRHHKQLQYSNIAGFGAVFLLFRGIQMTMPLFIVLGVVLAVVAIWFRWRGRKIAAFDALSQPPTAVQTETEVEQS